MREEVGNLNLLQDNDFGEHFTCELSTEVIVDVLSV